MERVSENVPWINSTNSKFVFINHWALLFGFEDYLFPFLRFFELERHVRASVFWDCFRSLIVCDHFRYTNFYAFPEVITMCCV